MENRIPNENNQKNLDDAVKENILSSKQAESLLVFIKNRPNSGPGFDFSHVLYYLGGMIAIGAVTLFMNLGWESFGGVGILCISLLYAGIGMALTNNFAAKGYPVPAGICATFVVLSFIKTDYFLIPSTTLSLRHILWVTSVSQLKPADA